MVLEVFDGEFEIGVTSLFVDQIGAELGVGRLERLDLLLEFGLVGQKLLSFVKKGISETLLIVEVDEGL